MAGARVPGRCRRSVIGLALLAGVAVAPGTGLAAGGQCRAVEAVPGGWTAAPLPTTPSAPATATALTPNPIVATAVVGQDPSAVLATDGVTVFRTTDGGCTWQSVFTVGASDYFTESGIVTGYTATNIGTSHDSRPVNQQDVYLALSPNSLNQFTLVTLFTVAPPELFAVSHDGGRTFAVVAPQPTATNPLVPECLSAPTLFVVPPPDPKTLYMQCGSGVAQSAVDEGLAGGTPRSVVYRSSDGGVSWTVVGLPSFPYSRDPHWFVPGVARNELWVAGNSYDNPNYHLAVWHSRDAGRTWTKLMPDPAVVSADESIDPVRLAVDGTPGAGLGRVVVYTHRGVYVTTDGGKNWQRTRSVKFTDGVRPPAAAFFLRHTLYVLFAGDINCKGDPWLVRYPTLGARPVTVPFPSEWGTYAGWATDATFALADHGVVATGLAQFCSPRTTSPSRAKLLSLRAR